MRGDLGDVVVRARGLALHLLSQRALEQLARSAGSGVLAGALQGVGYAPPPRVDGPPSGAADAIDDGIEHETARRLQLLADWLGPGRAAAFSGVFEDEERRALRDMLRRLAAGVPIAIAPTERTRRLLQSLAGAREIVGFVRALTRHGSPYGPPLLGAIRRYGPDLRRVESALDRSFAQRARRAAGVLGGRLAEWVAEGIDLENAWDALLQGGGEFLEGGTLLSRREHAAVSGDPDPRSRRRRLFLALGSLGRGVLDDSQAPLASLEARSVNARIERERRRARLDPLGAAPILWVVLRLRRERADLRRINAGIALGLPAAAIVAQLAAAA